MQVLKLEEAGFKSAMIGLAKSYKITVDKAREVSRSLYKKDGGHNKFLEHMYLWLDVTAPRCWWQEADTYRLSSKQSESTMHTLVNEIKRLYPEGLSKFGNVIRQAGEFPHFANLVQQDNFLDDFYTNKVIEEYILKNFEDGYASISNCQWLGLVDASLEGNLVDVKKRLPEGFLQSREWVLSYKTFRNILFQRHKHRLPHWPMFIDAVIGLADYPEYMTADITALGFVKVILAQLEGFLTLGEK